MTLPAEICGLPWWRQPSFAMMIALGMSLVLYPFADEARWLRQIAYMMDIVAVLMVVRLLRKHEGMFRSGWIISIPLVALQFAHVFTDNRSVELAMLCAQVVFHLYACAALMHYVLIDDVVELDELFAIASNYVLLALLWASAYAIVVHFDADAIFINSTNNPKGYVSFSDLVYYSLTTLTSTGYGEITPVSPSARALAMLQQWLGVLFVAMVIARMTNLYKRPSS
jgi:Ion channel